MISNYFSDICGGNGYIRLLSNVCVKLSRVNCTLQEAASYCSSDNATLFHIGTSDKYYSIMYLIKPLAGTFVIQDKLYSFYFHRSFLYFSFPVVRCTRYNLMKKVCQWPAECYWFSLCTYIFHFPWSGVLDTTSWKKVCQWPAECYWISLCTYIFHFPWSGVLDKPCETRCVSDLRKVVCFLFELIFFTSHGQV
jgi:hypothetical protein